MKGDYIGDYDRAYKGDTRSFDCSSSGVFTRLTVCPAFLRMQGIPPVEEGIAEIGEISGKRRLLFAEGL